MAVTTPPNAAADSYIAIADADSYFASTLNAAAWAALSVPTKEAGLRAATSLLDAETWAGTKVASLADNSLRWPRRGVYSPDGEEYPSDSVPVKLQQAVAELALVLAEEAAAGAASAAEYPLQALELGSVKLTYDTAQAVAATPGFTTRYASLVETFVAPFLATSRFSPVAKLVRA